MRRFVIVTLLVAVPLFRAHAQTERFRFPLVDDDLPAATRRAVDSLNAIQDSLHGCPPRSDTLWAADLHTAIPTHWLTASIKPGCRIAGLPLPIRRRLRDDPSSLPYYESVVRGLTPASENERSTAMQLLAWSAEPRFLSLFLVEARSTLPAVLADGDYNAAHVAILALAPYASSSPEARRLMLRAAFDRTSPSARQAGVLALAAVNDRWARGRLRALPNDWVDEFTQGEAMRALSHAACGRGRVFVVSLGIEGQDFSECALAPDYR